MSAPAVVVELFQQPRQAVVQARRRGRLPRSVAVLSDFRRSKRALARRAAVGHSLQHFARETERLAAEFSETAHRLALAIEQPAAGGTQLESSDPAAIATEAHAKFLRCGVALGRLLCAAGAAPGAIESA